VKLCKGSTLFLSDNSVDAIRWDWDFGDGFRSSQRNTDHTYDIQGVYNVTLNVYNECGCIDSKTIIVDVTPTVGPEIVCPSVVCEGDTATYHTTSICPAYKWEVTNGTIVGTDTDIEVKVIWEEHTGFLELNTFNCPGTCPEKTAIKIPVISDSLEIKGSQNTCFNEFETYFIDPIPESQ
jgi:PKD repeat protein